MTTRYDTPKFADRAANAVIRRLAQLGISIAGTQALRVRGRKTGKPHDVVINLLTVDGRDYLVSPRGNTHWARNVRAAGSVQLGPRWHRREIAVTEIADEDKPALLRPYLQRWFWEVKGHTGGLTPESSDDQMREVAPTIPVFALAR
jgi:deazaflavin-dependent oxidoreductase (nitroreductase family)